MPRKTVFQESDDDDDKFELLTVDEPDRIEEEDTTDDECEDGRLLAESDSDSAPEDVDFLSSRTSALQHARGVVNQIREERVKVREKRKKKEVLYTQQKKKKLEALASTRLPEELLSTLSASEPKARTKTRVKKGETKSQAEPGTKNKLKPSEDKHSTEHSATEDFIPLSSDHGGGIQAVCLREELWKSQTAAQTAAEFRQRHLYRKSVPRESTRKMLAKRRKKRLST